MKKNVVLVQPLVGDMDLFRDRPTPPLGLLCAASKVVPNFEIRLVDQRTDKDWRVGLAAAVDGGTVAVGITTFTGRMIRNALAAARQVKQVRDVPIVWGGIHPSLLPAQTARHELVDYVVVGEGENTFAGLVESLAAGSDGRNIPGVLYKRDGKVAGDVDRAMLKPEEMPAPPYAVVDMERYIQTYRGDRMFFYQSSRGCPCRCAYCYNQGFNLGRWRALPAERVLLELADLKRRYDFSLVYFLDDNFFIDLPRAMQIMAGLKQIGLGSSLQGVDIETLARLSDRELDFLEEAGVRRISIGVESGVDRVRREVLNKPGDVQLVRKQLARFKGRKIIVLCSFVLGFPSETAAEMRRTMELAMEILRTGENFRVPQFYSYSPYPGTELFSRLEREGFRFPSRLEDWCDYEYDFAPSHQGRFTTREALERTIFLSKFLDRKVDDFEFAGMGLKSLYNVYSPIARARLRTGVLWPLPERWFYGMLKGLFGQPPSPEA